MPTDVLDLPATPPKISDSQRAKVFAAEEHCERRLKLPPASRADIEVIADILELDLRDPVEGRRVSYWRTGEVEVGAAATLPAYLHEGAHHLTPDIFPPHGIEWVANFYGLLSKFTEWRPEYQRSFDVHKVRQTVDACVQRARKDAIYFANKESGCLARVVVDDPPQSYVCQLIDVGSNLITVFDGDIELELDMNRLRYVSATLSTPA